MADNGYSDEQLILAARLYFIDGLPQVQIGKLVNVSQSKISRMLALARERGIVRVTVPEYEPRSTTLERQLQERLKVDALVIRATAGLRIQDLRQMLGYFAAPVVSSWIGAGDTVAIAGGRTMQWLAEHMKPAGAVPRVTLVQAMGNIDSTPGPYDAVELGRVLSRRWNGTFLTLNTPALLPDEETCRRLVALGQVQEVMRQLRGASLVFVGIGTLENSVFVERKVLSPRDIATLREAGAVGEILGRFFDAAGKECATPFRERVVSLPLDALRRVKRVVAVLAGTDRTAAVLAATRGGLVKTLVLDEAAAVAILGGPHDRS